MSDNNTNDSKQQSAAAESAGPVGSAGSAAPSNASATKAGLASGSDLSQSSADPKPENQQQHFQTGQKYQGSNNYNYYPGQAQGSFANSYAYGQNPNTYNGSANFHNKNQYNNPNKHHSGNRQNYNHNGSNNNNGGKFNQNNNSNQSNPNAQANRRSFNNNTNNNNKQNHGYSAQQQQQQQQHQYMAYPYAAAPQGFQYYMPQYYVPVAYGPPGSQSYASPSSSASSGSTPQYPHSQIRTPPASKVKLTTKDGKPVDLEEKKKKTASSTPVASPYVKHASPAVASVTTEKSESSSPAPASSEGAASVSAAQTPAQPSAQPSASTSTSTSTSAPAPAPTLSAAEEFKRKIRERAAAAAAAKEKQKKQDEGVAEKKEPKEQPKDDVKQANKEEPKAEQVEAALEKKPVPEPKENVSELGSKNKDNDNDVDAGVAKESEKEVITSTHIPVTSSATETDKEATPTVAPTEPVDDTQKEQEATTEQSTKENNEQELPESKQDKKTEEAKESKDDVEVDRADAETTEVTTGADDKEQEEEEEEEEEEDADDADDAETTENTEPELNITQFMKKIAEVPAFTNILDVQYPDNFHAVDSSRQIPSKKYRYDPQFLMQFREVVQYPIDADFKTRYGYLELGQQQALRRSGTGRDSSSRNLGPGGRQPSNVGRFGGPHDKRGGGGLGGNASSFDSRQNSRTGSKRRGASTRDKSTRKPLQSKRGGRGNDSREPTEEELAREAPKPAEDVKPLEKTANRWVPKSRVKKTEVRYAEDGSVILEKEDVERKIKSLLNKLTLEMFNEITDEMLDITKQSKWETDAGTIKQTISLTFQKACDEPYWSEMYAKWCAKMTTNILPEISDQTSTLKDGSHPSGGALARRVLLTTCQVEYEKGWSDKLPTNPDGSPLEPEMMSDEYYAMAAAKRRGLGLVKFIGHLYNLNMLNDQVIYVCLKDQCSNTTDPSEDSLENLAQLIKTVGPKLDANERTKTMLKIVFDNIATILSNVKLSSRIKFMLMDLQDLRKAKWQSGKQDAQPTTIEAIHRDAEIKKLKEEREKSRRSQNSGRSASSHYGSSNIGGGGGGGSGSSRSNSGFGSNLASNSNFFRKSPSVGRSDSNASRSASERAGSGVTGGGNTGNAPASDLQRDSSRRSENQQINRFAALGGNEDEDVEDEGAADAEETS
ncbi:hypothetical protein KGF57_004739 [Candida theae]|uniref:MIF4G domain-containing protein n=1 Tax=Candida theae TaxID=1198502 RepID=A0AAD5FWW9_9ASCO|nr:uncharacterized protein KGF57_004739 [Candida theae]KAI5949529.1 hypothetical protein KGF57_004739 [Candida theae]